ncbi:MAG: hypothetical protein A3H34_00945 [Betaproteobacteria bacterium RIFCSPLOWO2_02_FULL_67_19]|nr:MAG: hypothetical protein A3H34_00945 [Betaproteobacteria bacterium RIFCSPLOWO2_02_FULL_67_19]
MNDKVIAVHKAEAVLLAGCVIAAALSYTLLFMYTVGRRVIQRLVDNEGMESLLVLQIAAVALTLVVTATATGAIFFDRTIAGRYYYLATALGVLVLGLATAAIAGELKAAVWFGKYTWRGVGYGNALLLLIHGVVFFTDMPSLL